MLSRNWTRYPISEVEFRTAYNAIYSHGSHGISATNPQDVSFLPLLFVVLAIAFRLAPEEIGGDARSRRVTSLRYYWSCEHLVPTPVSSFSFLFSTTFFAYRCGDTTGLFGHRFDTASGTGNCLSSLLLSNVLYRVLDF